MSDLTPTQIVSVGTDVGDVAMALAAFFKAADDIFNLANSPAFVAARQRADVQAILTQWDNDLKAAQASGNASKVAEESTG